MEAIFIGSTEEPALSESSFGFHDPRTLSDGSPGMQRYNFRDGHSSSARLPSTTWSAGYQPLFIVYIHIYIYISFYPLSQWMVAKSCTS